MEWNNEYYMQRAIKEALIGISSDQGGPFGSVIVNSDGEIVSSSHNMVLCTNDPTAHAEIEAIRQACVKLKTHDLSGHVIYTTAEPCPMCKGAIQWANIDKVYYGCSDLDTDDIGFNDFKFKSVDINKEQVSEEDCLNLFKVYSSIEHDLY